MGDIQTMTASLTGRYRARGENTKTSGGVVGEMILNQAGSMLVGTYRFWEERGTEPVSFALPWHDCDVTGEVCEDEIVPREKAPSYEDDMSGGWDVVLRIGDQDVYGVLLADGDIALSSQRNRFSYCEILYRQLVKPFADLIALLGELGSANNAADRGYSEEAQRMRANAFAEIRRLIQAHPLICDLLTDLRAQLDDGSLAYFGWANQLDRAQAHLQALQAGET
jgi:hypothetical protein